MSTTEINKKALETVAAELNEKRKAGITGISKMSIDKLSAAILEATENGTNLTKLNKESRQVVGALLDMKAPTETKTETAPPKEKGGKAESKPKAEKAEATKLPEDLTSREAMNLAAHDMNECMGLEPGVDTSLPDDQFHEAFTKAANMAKTKDSFNEFTWNVLEALGVGPKRPTAAPAKEKTETKKAPKSEAKKPAEKTESKPKSSPKAAEKAETKTETAPPKEKGGKAESKPKAEKGETKKAKTPAKKGDSAAKTRTVTVGVLEFIDGKKGKPFTIAELYEQMKTEFPEKNATSLLNTVRAYVPHKVRDQYGYTVTKDGDNFTAKKK